MPEMNKDKITPAADADQNQSQQSADANNKMTPDDAAVTGEGTGAAAGGYGGFADPSEKAYATSDEEPPSEDR